MFTGGSPIQQKITPTLMFTGGVCGKAEEAIRHYASVFHNSKIGDIFRYGRGEDPEKEGTIKFAPFTLDGQQFAAMDSARGHNFDFNEAISFMVYCDTQDEIDYYWEKLSVVPAAEQCGWVKDRFGLSWQIVPRMMETIFKDRNQKKLAQVTQAFLKMKKFDIEALRRAYEG
jgi:predicted 3-demethylubiquinone-9 3-methyltransferase (glyoxalase superfamily)